jgi:hypothetical protein
MPEKKVERRGQKQAWKINKLIEMRTDKELFQICIDYHFSPKSLRSLSSDLGIPVDTYRKLATTIDDLFDIPMQLVDQFGNSISRNR